jgi:hypothetical protein
MIELLLLALGLSADAFAVAIELLLEWLRAEKMMDERCVNLLLRSQNCADQRDRTIEVRRSGGTLTVRSTVDDKIAVADPLPIVAVVRLCSSIELWNNSVFCDRESWVILVADLLTSLVEIVAYTLHIPMPRHLPQPLHAAVLVARIPREAHGRPPFREL